MPQQFMAGGGEMGARIRAFDWSATSVGSITHWPQSLRTMVGAIINSDFPSYLLWGPDLIGFYNDAYRPIIGSKSDILGVPFREAWAEMMDDLWPIAERALKGQASFFENRPLVMNRNGYPEEAFFTFCYSPVRDESGDVAGVLDTVIETTDTVLAQRNLTGVNEALRLIEERHRLVARATNDAIWDWDLVTDHVVWNEALTSSFGYDRARVEPTPQWWTRHIHPDDRAAAEADIRSAIDGDKTEWSHEYRFLRADGRYAVVLDRGYMVRDASGKPLRMIGAMLDLTERKRAEDALRLANQRLEERVRKTLRDRDRVWTNSRDVLILVGIDGVIRAVNPAWTALLGHEEHEVVGHTLFDFIHVDDIDAARAGIVRAARETIDEFENRFIARDGSIRWLSWSTSIEGDLIYGYGRNITRQKEQELMLQATSDALRQSQKMEALGQLTGGIAHDFNNLLTGIMGSLELMERRLPPEVRDANQKYLAAATTSASRAAALTQRLLAFARRQSLETRPVDLNELVLSLEEMLARTLGPHIALNILTDGSGPVATTDINQLESALLNLAINARDAMPNGGRLTIATSIAHLDAAYAAQYQGLAAGDYATITVSDTGAGMAQDVLSRAYEPFFTTKPIGQGTGLGLSMIYGFVKQVGGHIRIHSRPDQGTAVRLYFPQAGADASATPAAGDTPAPMSTPQGEGETVLVVDDETAVRTLVGDILRELGYNVIEAAEATTALPVLEGTERLDLLISDVGLPGMNGRQLAEVARQRRPDLKVLFITGYAQGATIREDFLGPGMEMLAKPFTYESLATKVREMIDG